jgi:hypothetical protein
VVLRREQELFHLNGLENLTLQTRAISKGDSKQTKTHGNDDNDGEFYQMM